MSDQSVLEKLKAGARQFQVEVHAKKAEHYQRAAATPQAPHTLIISCADSRVDVEAITSSGPGEVFVTRNIGNMVPPYGLTPGGVTAVIEYAVAALKVQHVVICGHSDCGAMTAIASCKCLDHMPAVASWLRYADSAKIVNEARKHRSTRDKVESMVRENVIAQLANLKTHPSVRLALEQGRLTLHGWVYDIESGSIDTLDGATDRFVPLADNLHVCATAARLNAAA